MLRLRTMSTWTLLASSLALAACSTSDGEAQPDPIDVVVKSAEGGIVSDGQNATLTIPPGALAEDTEITLAILAGNSKTLGKIYDFGPDGLNFTIPAMLSLKVDPKAVAGKQVAVALEEGGSFVALAGSVYADGVVTAPIEHFSRFTVVLVGGAGSGGTIACDQAVKAFSPCGGNIEGTWVVNNICAYDFVPDDAESCREKMGEVSFELDDRHSITFAGGQVSNPTYTSAFEIKTTFPVSCAHGLECSDHSIEQLNHICGGTDHCTCFVRWELEAPAMTGTYTTSETRITIDFDGQAGEYEYCVQGDTFYLQQPGGSSFSTLTVWKRK